MLTYMEKNKLSAVMIMCLIFLVPVILCFQCPISGKPAIDKFNLLYDIVSVRDGIQTIEWGVSNANSVTISLEDESGSTLNSQSLPPNSNGTHAIPLQSLKGGFYKVRIEAANQMGSTSTFTEFLLVDENGIWYKFLKIVDRPPETNPWFGFNTYIVVGYSQGMSNEKDVISISEQVFFRHFKWEPDPLNWADQEGCTSPGLNLMAIKQYTLSMTCDKGIKYLFPAGDWKAAGTYHCAVDWSPCNYGIQGDIITDSQVGFYFYLESFGK